MKEKVYSIEWEGKTLTAELSDLAQQAHGSVIIKYGNSVVLVTAVMSSEANEKNDFLPLSVEYEEKFYASGHILGSRFVRREGKPSDEAILCGRIVDRAIRPLFDQWIRNEIQIVISVLSLGEDRPDTLAVIGASLALGISHIPWKGPVSAVRLKNKTFDLVVCGRNSMINMIECAGDEVSEDEIAKALRDVSTRLEKIQIFQENIIKELGRPKKEIAKPEGPSDKERGNNIRATIIDTGKRPDGRSMDEIRPLYAQIGGVSPTLHGTGIFYRGQTHVMSVLTLGTIDDSQIIDDIEEHRYKRFIHHYNFPPFSTGETGRINTSRRMIGHGALVEKALVPILPPAENFSHTIRIVSEVFSSNGSSSMASVCAATLALIDAKVPIKKLAAGISIGLMMRSDDDYQLLTDIAGEEDHYGDMDFKVAGTREGITAIQMDVKIEGIPLSIFPEALEKARTARLALIDVLETQRKK